MKRLLIATIWLGFATGRIFAATATADCELRRSLLVVYNSPDAPSTPAFNRLRDSVYRLMSCPSGPMDDASRAALFAFVEREMTFDYRPFLRQAARGGSEAAWESTTQFQHELLRYIDTITTARDIRYQSTILRFCNAKAIAALGTPVRDEVLRQAAEDQPLTGLIQHSPRQEALGALGFWIDPSEARFTAPEKAAMLNVLIGALQENHGYAMTMTIVKALGHSDRPEAEQALLAWIQHAPSSLRDPAQQAAEAVHRAAEKQ